MTTDTTQPAGAQSPSDTPRCDYFFGNPPSANIYPEYDFARTLERELQAAHAALAEAQARTVLDNAWELLEGAKKDREAAVSQWKAAEVKLAEAIEQGVNMNLRYYAQCALTSTEYERAEKAESLVSDLRKLIAGDGIAITFQSLGQYRTFLLKSIDAAMSSTGEGSGG